MTNKNEVARDQLPSVGRLVRSTFLALAVAILLLLTVILPAEYGIDPLGAGGLLGLTEMGAIKVSLAEEIAAENMIANDETIESAPDLEPARPPITETASTVSQKKSDQFSFTLSPNEGKEIKLAMAKGATVDYVWFTDGAVANFDAHADSKPLEIKYHNYEKGKESRSEGVLEAAFEGNHGWFWRNRNSESITVTLEVTGEYSDVLQF